MITCQLLVPCCPRLLWEPFFDCGQFGKCSKYQNHDTEMPAYSPNISPNIVSMMLIHNQHYGRDADYVSASWPWCLLADTFYVFLGITLIHLHSCVHIKFRIEDAQEELIQLCCVFLEACAIFVILAVCQNYFKLRVCDEYGPKVQSFSFNFSGWTKEDGMNTNISIYIILKTWDHRAKCK